MRKMKYITGDDDGNIIAFPEKPELVGGYWLDGTGDEDDRVIIFEAGDNLRKATPYCVPLDQVPVLVSAVQTNHNHEEPNGEILVSMLVGAVAGILSWEVLTAFVSFLFKD